MKDMLKNKRIGIIGSGNMGKALIGLILSKKLLKKSQLIVSDIDRKRREHIRIKYNVIVTDDNSKIAKIADIIILAVKPQDVDCVLKEIKDKITSNSLIISIVAGIKTRYIEETCGRVPVIRVMPNVVLLIGEAVSAISFGRYVKKADRFIAKVIFKSGGDTVEVKENLIDAVTAISGSGPAYVAYLINSMVEAGVRMNLKRDVALKLVTQTVRGTPELLRRIKLAPKDLIKKVASKGGTTEAALKVFERKKMAEIIQNAVFTAMRRSRKLSRIKGGG